jgi:hypothetical protein
MFLLGLLSLLGSTAHAGTVVCSGKVAQLAYHANDRVMIRLDSMNTPVFFCSPESVFSVAGTTYTTGPETCKLLYSTFLSAQITQKAITSMYFDGDDVPQTCDTWLPWKRANIRFYTISN